MLGIIHDTSKCIDGNVEEFRSAISHTKESKAPINLTTHVLNPFRVLSLFKRILDEVHIYIYVDFFGFVVFDFPSISFRKWDG